MTLNLNTIILFVQNVDKLKSFYSGILKLEVAEEIKSEWLLLKAGNCSIGLHRIGEEYRDESKNEFDYESNIKIVFEMDEDINIIREELISKKVVMREIKLFEDYGYFVCDGVDPEGNVFQLKQKITERK